MAKSIFIGLLGNIPYSTDGSTLDLTGNVAVSGIIYGGGLISPVTTVSTITTAGDVTYTGAQIAGGLILRDPNGANRADLMPTAADLLAVMPDAQVGQSLRFLIRNDSAGANTITLTTNTGITLSGTMVFQQARIKEFLVVFTNVTASSEAATVYSLGIQVF